MQNIFKKHGFLFEEDGGGGANVQSNEGSTGGDSGADTQATPAADVKSWGLVKDPQTGVTSIENVTKPAESKPAETKPDETKPAETKPAGLTNTTLKPKADNQPYTPDEFAVAMQLNNVDNTRVPEQYKADYTKMVNAKQAQTQAQPQKTPEQVKTENAAASKEFYKNVNEIAEKKAKDEVGITDDELEAAEYSDDEDLVQKAKDYKMSLEWNRAAVINSVQQEMARAESVKNQAKTRQEAIYGDIKNYVTDLKSKEPNFDKIDVELNERYKTLPYDQAVPIAETINALKAGNITPAQCQTLKKYYEDTRLDFYAKNNNLPTTPKNAKPQNVEPPGNGAKQQAQGNAPDYNSLGKMDIRGKDAFIANLMGLK
jgi:hypothetical protein